MLPAGAAVGQNPIFPYSILVLWHDLVSNGLWVMLKNGPLPIQGTLCDQAGALFTAFSTLAALFMRERNFRLFTIWRCIDPLYLQSADKLKEIGVHFHNNPPYLYKRKKEVSLLDLCIVHETGVDILRKTFCCLGALFHLGKRAPRGKYG